MAMQEGGYQVMSSDNGSSSLVYIVIVSLSGTRGQKDWIPIPVVVTEVRHSSMG